MRLPILLEKITRVYDTHRNIIIAVDFDDTIYDYSGQGFDTNYVVDLLKRAKEKLNAKLILFTCREDDLLSDAMEYCYDVGLEIDAVNTSLENYAYPSRKPFYNMLLDDKACLPECCAALEALINARS
jgi:hydroxymethylpyrimidine pyrophosphatase-like HAD family hydrolase